MLSSHFSPVEIDGHKFDKGMILFEFNAMREPEATRFPKVGEYIKAMTGMVEIPTPSMYWMGRIYPDLYISNQLDAIKDKGCGSAEYEEFMHPRNKSKWDDSMSLADASLWLSGSWFHNSFIEPMCHKIAGVPSTKLSAKYHRSIWLPMYWPETLVFQQSIDTKFFYPKEGYAGAALERFKQPSKNGSTGDADLTQIELTFVLAKPMHKFSVMFFVDHPKIYRITDQDECSGSGEKWHRFVIESRGELNRHELVFLWDDYKILGSKTINMPIPTIRAVVNGWKPAPNMNEMLWEVMNGP